ncbi:MAG: CoA transferase, partial [Pseudomonadota bacterium]|nr:CoA transferase [Pseudomonadota bacterium]
SELMANAFRSRSAKEWFAEAEKHRLTFALVQSVDDLFECPQLRARDALVESRGYRFPISGFRMHRVDADA